MKKILTAIKDFFLFLRDKIEEKLPEKLLTHKGKVRRLVLIEEKREQKMQSKKKEKDFEKTFNSDAFELISSGDSSFDRPGSEIY